MYIHYSFCKLDRCGHSREKLSNLNRFLTPVTGTITTDSDVSQR